MLRIFLMSLLNIGIVLALSPLLEGIMRKIKARIHSRVGPPLVQPYYDLAKLFLKTDQETSGDYVQRSAPLVCLGSVLLAALFTPMGAAAPLGFAGDAIVLVYLLTISAVSIILGGMTSGSPFAFVGANREMMLLLVVEPVLVITLFTGAAQAHSLVLSQISGWYLENGISLSLVVAGVAFFFAIQAEMAKIPFDLAEAETELMEGPFIEFSGRKLALFKWAMYAKQVVFASLFVEMFFPWPKTGVLVLDIIINLVKVLFVGVLVEVVAAVNPRLKIEQAIKYFAGVVAFALIGMALAIAGM